jgi:hypothetical protein
VKELHFVRTTGKMDVATEGPYRFVLHKEKGVVHAKIFLRERKRGMPWLDAKFPSRAAAIDWLARHRKPEVAA